MPSSENYSQNFLWPCASGFLFCTFFGLTLCLFDFTFYYFLVGFIIIYFALEAYLPEWNAVYLRRMIFENFAS